MIRKPSKTHNFLYVFCTARQINIGDELEIEQLMDVASEPHESNIYLVSNISALTQDIANRLSNVLCNSKHFITMRCVWFEYSIPDNRDD